MANCFRCGKHILDSRFQFRRRVKTGEFERRRYPGSKLSALQISFGIRIVCKNCARTIDIQRGRKELMAHLQVFAALIVLALALFLGPYIFK